MIEQSLAVRVIEALRRGIPPQRGVDLYSVGNEKLIQGIKKYHLSGIDQRGIIRFVSGSWGSGKTHFFRLLREVAFQHDCLVSNIELNASDTALNKFERVFYSIVRNIETPAIYARNAPTESAPFGRVVQEALAYLATGSRDLTGEITYDHFARASATLMAEPSIDIDFKKIIQKYWETYLPESAEPGTREQTQAEILQWFSGEGSLGGFRKRFGVNKVVSKDTAKLLFQSLAAFVRLAGYQGLLILFDEAEQAYSIMRKSALRDAHNNLLSLINNIESLPGLFLIYATTPDFYTDPKHGIGIYGALQGRIGKPDERSPRSLDTVWNLDAVVTDPTDYQSAAQKIKRVYEAAYPDAADQLPTDAAVAMFADELFQQHPPLSQIRFWRVLVSALAAHLDDCLEEDLRPTAMLYDDVMDRLREE